MSRLNSATKFAFLTIIFFREIYTIISELRTVHTNTDRDLKIPIDDYACWHN